ncbi:MAG TPA: MFS transporter [Gemmatimonadaceae bacterium]|jgi:ACS family hexuronate transporter-like MFS transporter|nr:MFS transporter [Gemmatimonadaceae bacterium]
MASQPAPVAHESPAHRRYIPGLRWWICGLLFLATTINYVDRQSLSVLKTMLEQRMGWSEADYGWIQFAFTAAYAAFPPIMGRVMDSMGVKFGLALALVLWSTMSMLTALARGTFSFAIARFFLGAAEAGNFPASIKAIGQWFPQRERALATGLFNSGTNVGVMVSFITVMIAESFGWQFAFIAIGAIGFVWLIFWQIGFHPPKQHPRLSPEELAYIESDQAQSQEKLRLSWTTLLRFKQIWPFLLAKLLTDPVWWFYLYWLPSYLAKERGQDILGSAFLLTGIYTAASVGSILGGWLSGWLIGRGWRIATARYAAMGIAAVCAPFAILAYYTSSFILCLVLLGLVTAAHQAWSANLFTTATDLFPSKVAGSVVGLGATTGGLGGMFLTLLAAMSIQWVGNQSVVFVWAGLMHPLSLLIFWLVLGRNFRMADVDAVLETNRISKPLAMAGGALIALGIVLTAVIWANWDASVRATSLAGAAQAATAAVGVALIGGALLYAGLHKEQNTIRAA